MKETVATATKVENLVNGLKKSGYSDSEIREFIKKGENTQADKKEKVFESEIMNRVSEIMQEIGMPVHIRGYRYVRYSIIYGIKDPDALHMMTKVLYTNVAKEFNTTPSRVERAIRNAIQLAWERGDTDVHQKYFRNTIDSLRGRPTNSEFIAKIADKIQLEFWQQFQNQGL